MKSVTIKDREGALLVKIIDRKSGVVDIIYKGSEGDFIIDIRDDKNCKVMMGKPK